MNNVGQWTPLPKDKVRWNMFGGTLGGPIIKNKLFFFADYQAQRFDIPSSTSTNTMFTSAERSGNFGALCSAGFDSSAEMHVERQRQHGQLIQPVRVVCGSVYSYFACSRDSATHFRSTKFRLR